MTPVRTVGHGTLPADDLSSLLRRTGIDGIADVRRFPGSRRHPQFSRESMENWLPASDIAYRWISSLGGRRTPDPTSRNVALRNAQFRAYADHMATEEFRQGIDDLLRFSDAHTVAVMCAESVWWRCHRRLLADHLVLVRQIPVQHMFHDGRTTAHEPSAAARVDQGVVVYDMMDQISFLESPS